MCLGIPGKVVETWEIGADADVVAFDAGKVFVACGDGHVYFADVNDEKTFGAMKPIETAPLAKHCAVDPKTHKLFIDTADFAPAAAPTADQPKPQPTPTSGTFRLLVYGR